MNYAQRLLVIGALVGIGLVLAFVMLEWSAGYGSVRILVLYDVQDPRYPSQPDHMGIYTPYGIPGVVLGVVVPLCLFAVAAYVALGTKAR